MIDTRIRTTIRILVALLAAALLSVGLANSHLTVIDSGVDYTDDGIGEAYLGLDFVDGSLVITIDDQAFDGSLSAIDFDVPDLGRENTLGNDIGAYLVDVKDVSWGAVGADVPTSPALHEMVFRHTNLSLTDGIAMYEEAFASLGFTAEVTDTAASTVKVATFTKGDSIVTIRFHSLGTELEVDLTVL